MKYKVKLNGRTWCSCSNYATAMAEITNHFAKGRNKSKYLIFEKGKVIKTIVVYRTNFR